MTDGWLFDSYPLKDKMILWIKQESANDTIRLEDGAIQSMLQQIIKRS